MNITEVLKNITMESERRKLIQEKQIFIDIQPLDGWDEWNFSIVGNDIMAPLCVLYRSDYTNPYLSYESALEAALEYLKIKNND